MIRATNFLTFKSSSRFFSAIVILLSITQFEVGKIYFQTLFKSHSAYTEIFDNLWLLSQLLGASLLGFLSDRYWKIPFRKPVAIFGVVFFLFSILALKFLNIEKVSFLLFFILANGLFGSYLGVARAYFFDQCHKKRIQQFAITIIFQCIAWATIGFLLQANVLTYPKLGNFIAYLFPLVLIGLFFTKNVQKPTEESLDKDVEIKNVKQKYFNKFFLLLIVSFFIMSFLYEAMPYYGEFTLSVFSMNSQILILGIGGVIGAAISMLFRKFNNLKLLRNTYLVTASLFCIFIIVGFYSPARENLFSMQFFFYSLIAAFLWVFTVKEFLTRASFNEDGLVMGFLESIDTLAELTAALMLSSIGIRSVVANNWFFAASLLAAFLIIHCVIKLYSGQKKKKI